MSHSMLGKPDIIADNAQRNPATPSTANGRTLPDGEEKKCELLLLLQRLVRLSTLKHTEHIHTHTCARAREPTCEQGVLSQCMQSSTRPRTMTEGTQATRCRFQIRFASPERHVHTHTHTHTHNGWVYVRISTLYPRLASNTSEQGRAKFDASCEVRLHLPVRVTRTHVHTYT